MIQTVFREPDYSDNVQYVSNLNLIKTACKRYKKPVRCNKDKIIVTYLTGFFIKCLEGELAQDIIINDLCYYNGLPYYAPVINFLSALITDRYDGRCTNMNQKNANRG